MDTFFWLMMGATALLILAVTGSDGTKTATTMPSDFTDAHSPDYIGDFPVSLDEI